MSVKSFFFCLGSVALSGGIVYGATSINARLDTNTAALQEARTALQDHQPSEDDQIGAKLGSMLSMPLTMPPAHTVKTSSHKHPSRDED